jgi:NDP-sugar pyrophosphorylase family protein
MQPLTATVPKALLDVNGEPFIAHQLRLLKGNGLERVIICAGHLGEMMRDYVGDGVRFGLDVDFSFDGPRPLGTAGALRVALPLLGSAFFVLYGDAYLPCNFRTVAEAFARAGALGLMTVFRNGDRWDASNVEYAAGRIIAYDKNHRTPRMQHLDYGLGVLKACVLDDIPHGVPLDLATVYQSLLARGELAAWEADHRFYEVGSPEGLADTRRYLASLGSSRPENAT